MCIWRHKGRSTLRFQAKMVDFAKKCQFLVGNMCNPARRTPGTAEREASVAEMLASEARRSRTRGPARSAYNEPSLCLFPGDRSRESCGRVNNSLKLLSRICYLFQDVVLYSFLGVFLLCSFTFPLETSQHLPNTP